ncbi:AAA domain-containing protein/AAA_assoc domain-containing protein [Cephalotus follicularis]|uniref:AAA domain-containing protein/AAA_assoc domain-containing protein n=1 Tax=Cephalotus follicularis TaxID=3775 RepID=A0A1Q3BB91_CEPFO|nr:AAA domain-containing protein/AAA_assoc domain-containing protein [Cephalotus follicularis]
MATLLRELPSLSSILSAYASISAMIMLLRTILNEMIPTRMQDYISTKLSELISHRFSPNFTYVIEERWKAVDNETFRAIEAYLPTKIGSSTNSLLLGSNDSHSITSPPDIAIPIDSGVVDEFEGMQITWKLYSKENKKYTYPREKRYFHLICHKRFRENVLQRYIPYVSKTAEDILKKRDILNIYTYSQDNGWDSTVFKHPSTFETLAMDEERKRFIMDDLDLFVNRKDFFESVGRAWKRGYLLYGPPGTGKSSLVAAIANYLRYNIYDLQFQSVRNDADLRSILTSTTNRSILLIEDIDCSAKVSRDRNRVKDQEEDSSSDEDNAEEKGNRFSLDPGATLSGLLNFIDGLWSSCGDERIIIFTTNHKDRLDPALLRPGRMDVHIHMGHCTPVGLKKLVTTYLGIKKHDLLSCIEDRIQRIPVTPAEVAQHLMKSDTPEVALQCLIEFLDEKGLEKEQAALLKEHQEDLVKKGKKVVPIAKQDMKHEESDNRSIYLT